MTLMSNQPTVCRSVNDLVWVLNPTNHRLKNALCLSAKGAKYKSLGATPQDGIYEFRCAEGAK
jgi:hypothetical protein